MNENESALLAAVRDNPEDDLPRWAYADLLEESGQPQALALAELIRAQCDQSLWSICPLYSRPQRSCQRAEQILREHGTAWIAALPQAQGVEYEFHRGWPRVVVDDFRAFRRVAPSLVEKPEVFQLRLRRLSGIEAMLSCPELARFTSLSLERTRRNGRAIGMLTDCPHLSGIAELRLGGTGVGYDEATAIANSPHFARLRAVDLSINDLGGSAAFVFIHFVGKCPDMKKVSLGANDIHKAVHMIAHAAPPTLTALYLNSNPLGDWGLMDLVHRPNLSGLTTLDLSACSITSDGALTLMESTHLQGLTRLNLCLNDIGPNLSRKLRERFGDGLVR